MDSLTTQPRMPQRVPSSADWSRLRPIITDLYLEQRCTMDQVRHHLNTAGYRVNKRMVRARITQWNLHRNHQLRDMAAALRLLDLDPSVWSSMEPRFVIRGRIVTMNEIARFFRRKGIQDPLKWAHFTAVDREETHVKLLYDDKESVGESTGRSERPMLPPEAELRITRQSHPPKPIITLDEIAVASLKEYCSGYIGLGQLVHQEPQVHQFTIHGQFGEWMRDGLAHMTRNTPDAFPNFRRGFELVPKLLSDCHPMALGQYLAVVCILATHQADSILSSLIRFVASMGSTLELPKAVAEFLIALQSSQDVLSTAVLCLRAAVGVFTEQHSISWQKLYLQERLCDCLYYGNAYTEGSAYRARLFWEQEALYGPFARNVIYTLTNVADDRLCEGDVDMGRAQYMMALQRAEHLTELGRAKIRFAALEGLAHSEQIRFEKLHENATGTAQHLLVPYLQEAYRNINEAICEAQTWFRQSNRRMLRALDRRTQIGNLLASITSQNGQGETCEDNGICNVEVDNHNGLT